MKPLKRALARAAGLFSKRSREEELAEEMAAHLKFQIEENLRAEMSPVEARREATLRLGGVEAAKEAWRDTNSIPLVENLLQDSRFALRQLRKNPSFALTAVLVLALGACASVSIFAFVDAALIKPLPYPHPEKLVGVFESVKMFAQSNLSYQDYLDWKRDQNVFTSLEVYSRMGVLLRTESGTRQAPAARVSDSFFRTLGVAPVLGRDFLPGEDLPSAPRTVILSHAAWQTRYGGAADILGRTVNLNGFEHVIVGVMPVEFHFAPAATAEFWTTLHATNSCDVRRSCHNLYGVARLKDGVSPQAALANVTAIARRLESQYPDSNRGQGASLAPLTEVIVGDVRPLLLVLLSGAGLLLLIACINVASLLLARAESRRREMAVRGALGASRLRLISQFVAEGLLLSLSGTAIGLIAAYGAMGMLAKLVPEDLMARMPFLLGMGLNYRVLGFASLVALFAVMLFTLIPALRLSTGDAREALAEGSRGSSGTTWRRFGSHLVVMELATALVLLTGAGLLGKSFYRLLHVDLGLQPDHLATLNIGAPALRYGKDEQAFALQRELTSRVSAVPGVQAAGLINVLPVGSNGNTTWIRVVGRPYHGEHNEVLEREVSVTYFTTIGAKLARGRHFNEADDISRPLVAIINEAFVRQYFPGEDPIGKLLSETSGRPPHRTIVGIVKDIKEGPLDAPIPPVLYLPLKQAGEHYFALVVRTAESDQALLPVLETIVREIDPEIATANPTTMNDRISDSPSAYIRRSSTWLLGSFAVIALLLGVVGLYGVIAYSVSQRTREIGVRMALGAQRRSVYELVLREAGWLILLGTTCGLVCSVGAASLIPKLLFGTPPWDVATLALVATVLAAATLLASFLPARRAASVNPVDALRGE